MSKYRPKYSFEALVTRLFTLAFGYIAIVLFLQHQKATNPQLSYLQTPSIPSWFWALFALLIEAIAVYIAYLGYQQYRLSKAGIREIDKMTGDQFEDRLVILFRQLGYGVTHYSKEHRGNEYGADIIIEIADSIIRDVLAGKRAFDKKAEHIGALNDLFSRGAEAIILGCTELPLAINYEALGNRTISSDEVLAEGIVDYYYGSDNQT